MIILVSIQCEGLENLTKQGTLIPYDPMVVTVNMLIKYNIKEGIDIKEGINA